MTIAEIQTTQKDNNPVWILGIDYTIIEIGVCYEISLRSVKTNNLIKLSHSEATALLSAEPMRAVSDSEFMAMRNRIGALELELDE